MFGEMARHVLATQTTVYELVFFFFLCTTKSRLHIGYFNSLKNKTFIQTGSGNKLYTESKQKTLKWSMTFSLACV